MSGFALSIAIIMLVSAALLWFDPQRALRMMRVDFSPSMKPPPSQLYRVASIAMLLAAFVLIFIAFVPE